MQEIFANRFDVRLKVVMKVLLWLYEVYHYDFDWTSDADELMIYEILINVLI